MRDAVPGATRPVNVTVANGLDREVRQLRVVATSPTASFEVSERVRATLAAGEDATLRFPATVDETGTYPVNVTLVYTDEEVRSRITRTFRAPFGGPENPAEVALTGTEAVASGGSIEISVTAGNVGSTDAEAVVVSVGDAPNVAPADYFVGRVEASDFASFTLQTSASGNVSSVPLEIRYVVDGVERSYATEVPVERRAVERPDRGGGGGLPLVPAIGATPIPTERRAHREPRSSAARTSSRSTRPAVGPSVRSRGSTSTSTPRTRSPSSARRGAASRRSPNPGRSTPPPGRGRPRATGVLRRRVR
ncbi:MAG: hypothetical protein V5A62_04760 [Haloarculaceae archaeon]